MAGGVIRLSPARSKTLVGRILPISQRHRRGAGAAAGTPRPRPTHSSSTATASPIRRWRTARRTACQAAGVPARFLHDCRRTAARNLIRASVPERVAMLLTGHKSRAIFDRYNIIHEQELLATPGTNSSSISRNRRRRCQPASGPTRPTPPPRAPALAPPPRATRHRVRAAGGGGGRTPPACSPRLAHRPNRYEPASDRGTRGNTGRADAAEHRRVPGTASGIALNSGATRDHRLSRHPWLAPL